MAGMRLACNPEYIDLEYKMLKIVLSETSRKTPTLELEGKLVGPWVEELRRSCEAVLSTGAKLTLDLSEVSFLDRNGVELVRSLTNRNVALLNCSRFVVEQLRA